jgi:hypothetical protein
MRLGDLIQTLSELPAAASIVREDGTHPGPLTSWRGRYNELTLPPGDEPCTVGDVLADARAAIGKTFVGYKGGDYVMGGDTPVWADDYGDCNYDVIKSVTVTPEHVVLTLDNVADYV